MMPEDSVYGPWPQSGEIDIMETRGNNVSYKDGGKDIYSSTLHWGKETAQIVLSRLS
jgi:beta-glucanase (GH16 family)